MVETGDDPSKLQPEDEVSHYGQEWDGVVEFKCAPDAEVGEEAMSLIWGRVDRAEAAGLVCSWRRGKPARDCDAVRHSTVGQLQEEGFIVTRDPLPYFEEHLQVEFPDVWDDDVCERFHKCFSEPLVGTVENG